MKTRLPLADYLAMDYPFNAVADPDGGYVILFPDLPGCMTQVETIDEVGSAAAEIKELWLEAEYERGAEIPLPSHPEAYSGKFNLRLPKSLHRRLVEQAEQEGVSLNQLIVAMLSERAALGEVLAAVRALGAEQAELRRQGSMIAEPDDARSQAGGAYAIESEPEPAPSPANATGKRPALVLVAA
jgi:predicted RNase H-like HicB family nuclease